MASKALVDSTRAECITNHITVTVAVTINTRLLQAMPVATVETLVLVAVLETMVGLGLPNHPKVANPVLEATQAVIHSADRKEPSQAKAPRMVLRPHSKALAMIR
jgi:short-subunit dehydrogenase involved in D-alanine esterification of teichoic acids